MAGRIQQLAMRAMEAVQNAFPKPGRIVQYDPHLDGMRQALTARLTFSRIESILAAGKDGDLAKTLLFFEEMEQKDGRLRSVAGTRRRALTGLDYEIVSAAEMLSDRVDKTLADEAAAYVRDTFARLDGCGCALKHLATAVGHNLAVCEIEWENFTPIDIFPVPSERLTMQPRVSADVRVITREERNGIPATTPKFIVHIPEPASGSPLWKSLAEGHAWIFLIKKLALSDWSHFCELFGIPFRHTKYPPAATPAEKAELAAMMKGMGSAGYALTSNAVQMELVESNARGVAPFEAVMNWCNREEAVMYLGGNLTSDTTGGTGTFAAAKVQDDVRGDLRDDDIQGESRTVRGQIIRPVVQFEFPKQAGNGEDKLWAPFFRRIKPETVDRLREAQVMRAAQSAGAAIPRQWAYKRLSIPEPKDGEDVLEPTDAFVDAVREETDDRPGGKESE